MCLCPHSLWNLVRFFSYGRCGCDAFHLNRSFGINVWGFTVVFFFLSRVIFLRINVLYVSIYAKSHTFSSTEYRVIYGTHIQCLYLCFLFLCRIFLFHFYLNSSSSSSSSIGSCGSSISISGWLCGTVDLSAICVYFQCLGQFVYAAFSLCFPICGALESDFMVLRLCKRILSNLFSHIFND